MAARAPIATKMLWGRFEHSLDDKGRVIVPLKFREPLGEAFMLTIGVNDGNHIRVYPMDTWNRLEEQIESSDVFDEFDEHLGWLQRVFGNSEVASYDQQNRLTIPRFLREHAGLRESDPAVIVGSGSRLEIWSRNDYDRLFTESASKSVIMAAQNQKSRTQDAIHSGPESALDAVPTQGDSTL